MITCWLSIIFAQIEPNFFWVHAFVSVTCKYKFALRTLQEYFLLRVNGSKYRVQRFESIINISFAAAAALFRTLVNPSPACGKSSKTYVYYTFETLHSVFTTILLSAGNTLAEFVTQNLYLHVTDTNACTQKKFGSIWAKIILSQHVIIFFTVG